MNNDTLNSLVSAFQDATGRIQYTSNQLALWAVEQKLLEPSRESKVAQLKREIGRSMREATFEDPQGRTPRQYHSVKDRVLTADGTYEQQTLWADMTNASTEFMAKSCTQRRTKAVEILALTTIDADSFNDNYNQGKRVQIELDLTEDVQEKLMEKQPELV